MTASRWARLAAASGIVFVVLLILGAFIVPSPPKSDASAAEIAAYFSDHHSAVLIASLLSVLALPFFLWFLSALRAVLLRAEGDSGHLAAVTFGAGIFTAGTAMLATILGDGLDQRIAVSSDGSVVRAVYELYRLTNGIASAIGLAILLGAASFVFARSGIMPRWLGWFGYLAGGCALVAACAVALNDTSGLRVLGTISLVGFALWVLLIAGVWLQHVTEPSPHPGHRVAPA